MPFEQRARTVGIHAVLIAYSALAVGPILLVVMNSFKARNAIFGAPLAPPNASTFSLVGYEKVFRASHIAAYFGNSLVTGQNRDEQLAEMLTASAEYYTFF